MQRFVLCAIVIGTGLVGGSVRAEDTAASAEQADCVVSQESQAEHDQVIASHAEGDASKEHEIFGQECCQVALVEHAPSLDDTKKDLEDFFHSLAQVLQEQDVLTHQQVMPESCIA